VQKYRGQLAEPPKKAKGGKQVLLTSPWGKMHFLQLVNATTLRLKA